MSRAVPGADQAVTTGALNHQLNTMPETPAPMQMAQTHEASISGEACADCAAWK